MQVSSDSSRKLKVALLGLGAMGSRMGGRLLDAEVELVVFNRTPEKAAALVERGARLAAAPRAAAAGCDVVLAMVQDDAASKEVWLDEGAGALSGMREDALAMDCSTLSHKHTHALAQHCAERAIAFVEAPVVGTLPHAEQGQLKVLGAGEAAALDQAEAVIRCFGTLLRVGGAGQGAALKLAVNALFGVQVAALSELLSMLRNAGINTERAVELLNQMPTASPVAQMSGKLIAAKQFDPLFPIQLVEKDLNYLVQAASNNAPVVEAARQLFERGVAAGHGGDNIVGVAQLYP